MQWPREMHACILLDTNTSFAYLAAASGTILVRLSASSSSAAHTGLLRSVAALPSTHSACTLGTIGEPLSLISRSAFL